MMNKKLIISISAVLLIVISGLGIYQSDAAKSNPELTYDDVKQIAEAQYPGTITEIELDKEHGNLVYEVEIKGDDREYEVKLDANTGEIVKLEEKNVKQNMTSPDKEHYKANEESNKIKVEDDPKLIMDMTHAIEIAIQEFPGTVTEAELDEENGRMIYEIEIKSKGQEAEIEIDAQTGEILVIEIDD